MFTVFPWKIVPHGDVTSRTSTRQERMRRGKSCEYFMVHKSVEQLEPTCRTPWCRKAGIKRIMAYERLRLPPDVFFVVATLNPSFFLPPFHCVSVIELVTTKNSGAVIFQIKVELIKWSRKLWENRTGSISNILISLILYLFFSFCYLFLYL